MKQSQGEEAVFLIPNGKLASDCGDGFTIQNKVQAFLTHNYGAFRIEASDIRGFWKGAYDGIYTKFVVAFLGKEKIPPLEEFLEALAQKMGEESIYFRAGKKVWLLSPDPDKKYPVL